jgi:hypothetical protein
MKKSRFGLLQGVMHGSTEKCVETSRGDNTYLSFFSPKFCIFVPKLRPVFTDTTQTDSVFAQPHRLIYNWPAREKQILIICNVTLA